MKKRAEHDAPTWPSALALACPECNHAFDLRGVRPDLGVLFRCFTHGWFAADSWTSEPQLVDTHHVTWRAVDDDLRKQFITGALEVLIRAGADSENLVLQSMVPDNSMQFVVFSEGDGSLVAQVSSRRYRCEACRTRPLGEAQEEVLFNLGYGPIDGGENYVAGGMPPNPYALADDAESVFYEAFEEPRGLSVWAIFSQPALAEAFYLAWNFRQ